MKKCFPTLDSPAVLSPMAGVTDVAFRALAKSYGAGMTYTEFVSSAAIVRGNSHSLELVRTDKSESPVAVQLFGNNVQEIVAAAQAMQGRFDVIDINCGCPAWKVIKTGAGSALLNDPARIHKFVSELVDAVDAPVTVKIRKGIDDKSVNAVSVAKAIEEAGGAAVAIHGRTQKQGYSGTADWDIIKQVKDSVSIPVIGNGDVFTPEVFKQRLEESGVDAIMIARGAMGNPFIFKQINDYCNGKEYEEKNGIEQFLEYTKWEETYPINFALLKNHLMQFTKGMVGGAGLRREIMKVKDKEEIKSLANRFLE